uniref:coiled-coil domain-containing protein 103 n=1 Tax=Ciona intestinalis TaxID=7719 RepID=UPI000180C849|nr:coiled-coil domain-containing protein 103 [Ciona intestinalis]|eukprot:XP_002128158.1 coiled-coil domain-containing protein 103 [Ciona intestinalis]
MDSDEFDDDLNFHEIQRELCNAVARDEKYQRENDAKFRAINQKVQSYDEFRDIVAASHLKPMERGDKLGGMSYQKWNVHSSKKVDVKSPIETEVVKTNNRDPKTTSDFMKIWNQECKTASQKYDLLMSAELKLLEKFFAVECPMGDVITALQTENSGQDHLENVLNILSVMKNSKRFALQLDFLTPKEKNNLKEVFKQLKIKGHDLEKLNDLSTVYNCEL